jgi:hypothetical protein
VKLAFDCDVISTRSAAGSDRSKIEVGSNQTLQFSKFAEDCEGEVRTESLRGSVRSTVTHADMRKLCSISFGQYDLHIRINALQQLNILITRDPDLVRTADFDWCLEMATVAAEGAAAFDSSPSTSSPSSKVDLSSNPLVDQRSETSAFSLQCCLLFRNLCLFSTSLWSLLTIFPESVMPSRNSLSDINARYLLKSLLLYELSPRPSPVDKLSKGDINQTETEHNQLFHLVCGEILGLWALAMREGSPWTSSLEGWGVVHSSESGSSSNRRATLIPKFLWNDFQFASSTSLDFLRGKYAAPILFQSAKLQAQVTTLRCIDRAELFSKSSTAIDDDDR